MISYFNILCEQVWSPSGLFIIFLYFISQQCWVHLSDSENTAVVMVCSLRKHNKQYKKKAPKTKQIKKCTYQKHSSDNDYLLTAIRNCWWPSCFGLNVIKTRNSGNKLYQIPLHSCFLGADLWILLFYLHYRRNGQYLPQRKNTR